MKFTVQTRSGTRYYIDCEAGTFARCSSHNLRGAQGDAELPDTFEFGGSFRSYSDPKVGEVFHIVEADGSSIWSTRITGVWFDSVEAELVYSRLASRNLDVGAPAPELGELLLPEVG